MYGYHGPRRQRRPKTRTAKTAVVTSGPEPEPAPAPAPAPQAREASLCFQAKCQYQFFADPSGFAPGQLCEPQVPQAVTLVIWDNAQHPLHKQRLAGGEYTSIEVPWHSAGGGHAHSNVVKMSAYVNKMQCHVGNTCILLQDLKKLVVEEGTVVLRHPFNARCCIALHVKPDAGKEHGLQDFDEAERQSQEMYLTAQNLHRAANITARICEGIGSRLQKIYDRLGPSFLPHSMGADMFTNLATMLPVTMGDNRLAIHMTQLQHTLNKRGGAVSLHAVVYFLHAASLLEGVSAGDDNSHFDVNPRLTFRVFRRTQTLFTIDGGADKYTSDVAPVGVSETVNIDDTVSLGLQMEETENMQMPWSQIAMRGDDCEDYAMAILLIALSLEFHADDAMSVAAQEPGAVEQYFAETPLHSLGGANLRQLLLRAAYFGEKIKRGELETCLACVAAGAPNMVAGQIVWEKVGGHECCFSKMQVVDDNGGTQVIDLSVLEGTNIANNTIHYTAQQCRKLEEGLREWFTAQKTELERKKKASEEIPAAKLLDGFRPELVQHMGQTEGRQSNTFYRCFFAIDNKLIMTRNPEAVGCDGDETQLGAHIDDIIATFMGNQMSVKFIELKGSELIDPREFAWYQDFARNVGLEAQAPAMTPEQWKQAMQHNIRPETRLEEGAAEPSKGWSELPAEPPQQFKLMRAYTEKMEKNESGGRLATIFSTKNERDGALPFMNVYISSFTCEV